MDFNENTTFYDMLNLTPDASPNEIREAYLRAKASFQRDSVALYSIMDTNEGEEMLRKIEKAYEILSNPQRRKEYDRYFGQMTSNVIPIDRTPPMEALDNEENVLIAPATDFGHRAQTAAAPRPLPPDAAPSYDARPISAPPPPSPRALGLMGDADIDEEIRNETEWSGAFLRRVREARRLAPEDVTNATRITKAYLFALEEENFSKLPAPVYIRGFINQVARLLRLPPHIVVPAYLARYQKAHPEKFR